MKMQIVDVEDIKDLEGHSGLIESAVLFESLANQMINITCLVHLRMEDIDQVKANTLDACVAEAHRLIAKYDGMPFDDCRQLLADFILFVRDEAESVMGVARG